MSEVKHLEDIIEATAVRIRELAFRIPPPNEVTPALVMLANHIEHGVKERQAKQRGTTKTPGGSTNG